MEATQVDAHLRLQSFLTWTRGRIAPHLLENDGERFSHATVQLIFDAYQEGHGPDAIRVRGQQLFAEIKASSKYAGQADLARSQGWPYPFPVSLQADIGGYVVKGGVGGQYRLDDVDLFVIEDGQRVHLTPGKGRKK